MVALMGPAVTAPVGVGHELVRPDPSRPAPGQDGGMRPAMAAGATWLVLLAIGAVLVWQLSDILLLVFFAVLIATVLRGTADKLAVWTSAPPRLMLAVVTVALVLAGCAVAFWIGPRVAGQGADLVARLHSQLDLLRAHYRHTPIGNALTSRLADPTNLEDEATGYVLTLASSTFSVIGSLFVVVVMSLYLAAAAGTYMNGAVQLVPLPYRSVARNVFKETAHDLRRWLLGQMVDMLVVGGLAAIGLYFLDVPVPFALATLAGLLTIIPYFGALAAAIPGILIGLTQSWMTAVWVAVIFLICHIVEGYIVAPLIQKRMVEMPPAVIIASMAIAATLFGPLGIVLGTPLAVVAMVLVRRVYLEQILRDPDIPPPI